MGKTNAVSWIVIAMCSLYNGNCEHKCIDTEEGPKCECPEGYLLAETDKKTCIGGYKSIHFYYIKHACRYMSIHTYYFIYDMSKCAIYLYLCK